MSSNIPRLMAALMLGAGVAAAGPVLADRDAGHGGCGHKLHAGMPHAFGYSEAKIEHMAKRLDLTGEQVSSLRKLVDNNRPRLRKALDQMAESRGQIRSSVKGGKVDDAQLRTAADNQGKAVAEMIVLRVQMKEAIDKLLTDAQRKKMHHMMMYRDHSPLGRGWGDHAD
ncbi:MAG TPA: Spy/CpxP family protein refolding chaperone [Gammaproteobacteria bacterium]|nr:Spy/CpxP family protein refolding chaperone [Gammaproteobacteria bacterium]